jgi:ubiquinone/menaquinone biosynthesis C-methylase UbiE
MGNSTGRQEILDAADQVAADNPWYTVDQIATQQQGTYRHNMRLRYDYVERTLQSLPVDIDGKTVVDLGCGDGQWSIEISNHHNPKLIGIDYNDLRLERYKQHIPGAEAKFGSCLEIPLDDNTADVVMFHQVLEHIPQPVDALKEVYRVLKPGGWLMLSVPNEGTWLKQQVQYRWLEPHALKSTDHVNFFTASSLRNILRNNGFKVKKLDTVGFYFPHNGISRRLITHKPLFMAGVAASYILPVLRDCLFAWCQPVKEMETASEMASSGQDASTS